jgi:hypothetical protein
MRSQSKTIFKDTAYPFEGVGGGEGRVVVGGDGGEAGGGVGGEPAAAASCR